MEAEKYRPYILFVDDDPRYAKPLQERAYTAGFLFIHYEDWEEAKTELEKNYNKYSVIVLDAQGKLNSDDKGDNPQHITKAIKDLSEARDKNAIHYCFLTGYYDQVSNYIPNEIKIFKKNKEEELFQYLNDLTKNINKLKVAKKYPETITYIENYFLDEHIKTFISLFSKEVENDKESIKAALSQLRVLNERNMDCLGLYDRNITPEMYWEYIKNNGKEINQGNRTIKILKYFDKNVKAVPPPIYNNTNSIYRTASVFAVHSRNNKFGFYFPSKELIESLKLGLLESINWVGKLIKSKIQ